MQHFTAIVSVFRVVVRYAPILVGLSPESSQHMTKKKPLKKHFIFGNSYVLIWSVGAVFYSIMSFFYIISLHLKQNIVKVRFGAGRQIFWPILIETDRRIDKRQYLFIEIP